MFPGPRCEGCGSREGCEAKGQLRLEYPRCYTPLRGVDPGRTATLLDWLARGGGGDPRVIAGLHAGVMDRFRADRLVYSDVLEASFSCDDRGAHLHRFSYAFPGFRADPGGVAKALLALCRPFGRAVEESCLTVIRAARSRAVAQVLFGYAADGNGRARVKLYLQFHGWEAPAALEVAGNMLGVPLGERLGVLGPLHLVGLDLGPRGLVAAKLYSVIEHLRLDDVAVRIGHVPLAEALREHGVTSLRNVLAIHRLTGPTGDSVLHPAEIDFSLPENDLHWRDVQRLAPVDELLRRSPEIAELQASFRIAVRRISGSVYTFGVGPKLNVYYVLAEPERGSPPSSLGRRSPPSSAGTAHA